MVIIMKCTGTLIETDHIEMAKLCKYYLFGLNVIWISYAVGFGVFLHGIFMMNIIG